MATKLRTFDFSQPSVITSPNEKAVYPWDEWLDGDIWQITEGDDFATHPLMMERIIRTRATARGAKVRLRHQPRDGRKNGDPFGVIVLQRTDVKGPAESKKVEQAAKRAATKAAAEKDAAATLRKAGIKPVKKAVTKTAAVKHPKANATPSKKAAPTKTAATKATPTKRAAKVGA